MKKIAVILSLLLLTFVAVPAIAANKVVVVPLSSSRVPQELVPLAQGEISSFDGVVSSTGSYGISSVAKNATGDVTVTFTFSWIAYPAVMTGVYGNDSSRIVVYSPAFAGNTIRFRTKDTTGTLAGAYFSFVVYGQKQ